MELSIVIPLFNEQGNLGPLHEELKNILADTPSHEIIFVDDGSSDGSADELRGIKETDPNMGAAMRICRVARRHRGRT
jgi:glycosyltransferase involved in cell wall biosynthesis